VSRLQLRGDRYAAVEASCCASAAPGLRCPFQYSRGGERKEHARIAAAHASGRWAQTIQRVAARRRRARRGAARGTRRDDDGQGHEAPRRAAGSPGRVSAPRPGVARLGVLGRAGQWAPRVGPTARVHSLALPAGGSEVSGAVGLLWQRHGCAPARQRLKRGDRGNVDRRHRRTRCLVPPLARPPSFGCGALVARSKHARTHARHDAGQTRREDGQISGWLSAGSVRRRRPDAFRKFETATLSRRERPNGRSQRSTGRQLGYRFLG
jgi:hypothetical protein